MKLLNTSFLIYLLVIAINGNAQRTCPRVDEFYRGRHKIDGMMYGHPYTTFDRKHGSFETIIANIRRRIASEYNEDPNLRGDIFSIYRALYNHAKAANPNNQGDGLVTRDDNFNIIGISSVPIWAKNNAFVFLIGLNEEGEKLDSIDTTGAARNAFRDRAISAFAEITDNLDNRGKGGLTESIQDNMQFYSETVMYWLQTYDLLKAAYELPELRNAGRNPYGFGDADKNQGQCTPRNKLRKMVRDFYDEVEGPFMF